MKRIVGLKVIFSLLVKLFIEIGKNRSLNDNFFYIFFVDLVKFLLSDCVINKN